MIEIRYPRPEEKQQWLPLWQKFLAWYGTEIDKEITDTTWQRVHDDEEPVYLYAAYHNESMVGFATFITHRSTWSTGYYCYLADLFIDETARNLGIGTKLINAVKEYSKNNDCQRLYWDSLSDNLKARALYRRLATEMDYVQYRVQYD